MIKEFKLLTGVTQNDELYFLEIDPTNDNRNGHPEFTMSGFTVTPVTREDAIKSEDDYLDYEGQDLWIQAVDAKNTTLGLDDWIEQVKDEQGELGSFDNSLFTEEVTTEDGTEYLFRSESCGQHEEENLKAYFIPRVLFDSLMTQWKLHHMKDVSKLVDPQARELETVIGQAKAQSELQDITALAIKAIEIINA